VIKEISLRLFILHISYMKAFKVLQREMLSQSSFVISDHLKFFFNIGSR